jgi:hypothetical protein
MGTRARGANAVSALAFESVYGAPPADGYFSLAFVSDGLGEEQGLIASDLLGQGREPLAPSDDVVNNDGDLVVPVDLRQFGLFLKLMFGPPTTTQGVAAVGSITFAGQPANNATVTINGAEITFVTGAPTSGQVKIGATLADTVKNLVTALNASADEDVAEAAYGADAPFNVVTVTHKTIGTAGNSFTLARGDDPASNATVSGATLSGGSATGAYNHVFTSGSLALPSASIEMGQPEVPAFSTNYGMKANTLTIALARSGNLNATMGLIGQGETPIAASSQAGDLETFEIERFSQFSGGVRYLGLGLANIVSANLAMSNNLDKAENIRPDGRIDGADEGMFSVTPSIVARFADTQLLDVAQAKAAIMLQIGWTIAGKGSLTFQLNAIRLPKPKRSRSGPGGIQATYAGQGQRDAITGKSLVVTLVNDVASYADE